MYKYRRMIVAGIAGFLVLALVLGIVLPAVFGESSGFILDRIEELKQQEEEIQGAQQELLEQQSENRSDISEQISRKMLLEQQIKLTQDSIDVKEEMMREYSLLIAEKQKELDAAIAERDAFYEQHMLRIRSMEEYGDLTYWAIFFNATSFSDMLDRVDMIQEISEADNRMLESLQSIATEVEEARKELAVQKIAQEEAKEALEKEKELLAQKQSEAEEVITLLRSDEALMEEASLRYEAEMEEVLAKIAQREEDYNEALEAEEAERKRQAQEDLEAAQERGRIREEEARRKAEEEARRKAEEEARRKAEEEARRKAEEEARRKAEEEARRKAEEEARKKEEEKKKQQAQQPSSAGFIWPTDCHRLTDTFGPRVHPITGQYSSHSGIDIAASAGDYIRACAAGTVVRANYQEAFGYNVIIDHGNGFKTLYGHMTRYTVSVGDTVYQGEVIGYVGSTGWATGPHLHLSVYKNGELVNPVLYLP